MGRKRIQRFKRFIVTNLKTKESFRIQSPTAEKALNILSSENPIGGGWRKSDCEAKKIDDRNT